MASRKDGRPRSVPGVPYVWTSLYCRHGEHDKCSGCPSCECHVPVRKSVRSRK